MYGLDLGDIVLSWQIQSSDPCTSGVVLSKDSISVKPEI